MRSSDEVRRNEEPAEFRDYLDVELEIPDDEDHTIDGYEV